MNPIYAQSAAVPYRFRTGGPEVLLITSSDGKRWVIPKGLIEPQMTPAESAANEAFEEAGISGEMSAAAVGRFVYRKWGGTCDVEVFLLHVTELHEEWPEMAVRTREWLTVEDAARRVSEAGLKQMLLELPALVSGEAT